MPPYSGMKAIHDQMIEESLEHHRHYAGQATQRQGLLQRFGQALTRLTARAGQQQESTLPGCSCEGNAQLLSVSYSQTQECA